MLIIILLLRKKAPVKTMSEHKKGRVIQLEKLVDKSKQNPWVVDVLEALEKTRPTLEVLDILAVVNQERHVTFTSNSTSQRKPDGILERNF